MEMSVIKLKVSTKGRYGLRIMLELAQHYNNDLLPVRKIAEKQEISEKYTEHIIGMLGKAGLVQSRRGAFGGYRLAAPPSAITVGHILKVTEGGISLVECTGEGDEPCKRRDECIASTVWREIEDAIMKVSNSITLADIIARYDDACVYRFGT